jgi:hypothetical protein
LSATSTPAKLIVPNGSWFKDTQGRTLLLRGVNLAGSNKLPRVPDGATWRRAGFYNHRQVSFVGRPFPLEEADEHFSRLRRWGLTFLRFLITWEAIEHAGPGEYDEAYLDYLCAVVKKAGEHDFCLFIDPHQDVWSRFSGGCGAPGWTFETVGMDITRFHMTGAALTHQEHGDPLPSMSWPTNHGKFASATMYTLFFGGNDFAPQTTVDGVPIQDFLQQHYFNAVKQAAERLKNFPHVIGYDTLNEPSKGYIGAPDVAGWAEKAFRRGVSPTILQSMLLAAGHPQQVEVWEMFRKIGTQQLNGDNVSLWREGFAPVWRQNGVWDVDGVGNPVILRPGHFSVVNGRQVDFDSDYFRPFVERFTREIRTIDPAATIFVDPTPLELKGGVMRYGLPDVPNVAHAPHWYDGLTLNLQRYLSGVGYGTDGKRFWPVVGRSQVRRSFALQVRRLVDYSHTGFNGVPTLIGETGIPFNINNKQAFGSGDFSAQVQALDDTLQAMEANLVSYTLWNYTPENSNARGDQWNDEDLSIFSPDQQSGSGDLDDGGRALAAVVRPYPVRLPGEPVSLSFNLNSRTFTCEFRFAPEIGLPAEFFVPELHYPSGVKVDITRGWAEFWPQAQLLRYFPNPGYTLHRVTLTPRWSEVR